MTFLLTQPVNENEKKIVKKLENVFFFFKNSRRLGLSPKASNSYNLKETGALYAPIIVSNGKTSCIVGFEVAVFDQDVYLAHSPTLLISNQYAIE